MPLISPNQIHEVLKSTEPLTPEIVETNQRANKKLTRMLEDANLGLPEVLENLANNMRCGDTGAVRLAATKTALELNGVLAKDRESAGGVQVTFVIADHVGINPILIPRTT